MSDQDALSAVALVVALVALVISVVQLLQAILGTAEGFRRTNRQIMGPFSQTRNRVLHFTELRQETRFRTPHFKFETGSSTQPEKKSRPSEEDVTFRNPGSLKLPHWGNGGHKDVEKPDEKPEEKPEEKHAKPFLHIQADSNKEKVLQDFITRPDVARISRLQRLFRWIDIYFGKPGDDNWFDREHGKAYAAGWLLLLDQLFEQERRVREHGNKRPLCDTVPVEIDKEQWLRPAIELELRSWDMMPPDVVRPLASIGLGDILTLCFRLGMEVHPEEKPWSADGHGHSFSPLRVQGLGTVVQYRFDPSMSKADDNSPASPYFAPSEACDKLAFGIIPANPTLGIDREWKVNNGSNFKDSIIMHFEDLEVSEDAIRHVREDMENPSEALCESLLLLCPPLVVNGLDIMNYVPPFPRRYAEGTLSYRESFIVLRARLNEMAPGRTDDKDETRLRLRESHPPKRGGWENQREWVGAVLNFFEGTQQDYFVGAGTLHHIFGRDAKKIPPEEREEVLRQLRTALADADQYLHDKFSKNGAYKALVAAHIGMALTVHTEAKKEDRKPERERPRPFRDGTGVRGVWPRKTETVHRYVDMATAPEDAKSNVTIFELFKKQYTIKNEELPKFSAKDIEDAWFTMMLRAILWGWIHPPCFLPWLPYKSRYYGVGTPVMIA